MEIIINRLNGFSQTDNGGKIVLWLQCDRDTSFFDQLGRWICDNRKINPNLWYKDGERHFKPSSCSGHLILSNSGSTARATGWSLFCSSAKHSILRIYRFTEWPLDVFSADVLRVYFLNSLFSQNMWRCTVHTPVHLWRLILEGVK